MTLRARFRKASSSFRCQSSPPVKRRTSAQTSLSRSPFTESSAFMGSNGRPRAPSATIWLYYWIYGKEIALSTTPQKRALKKYRKRLSQRGMARFEVLGIDGDRDLIRSLARRLAGGDPDSARIRATVRSTISGEPSKKGGILDALRRSPLVGADLDLKRPATLDRKVDL